MIRGAKRGRGAGLFPGGRPPRGRKISFRGGKPPKSGCAVLVLLMLATPLLFALAIKAM